MRRSILAIILGVSAGFASGSMALTAGLPVKAPAYKAAVAAPIPLYNWTGIYLGARGGWAWGDSHVDDNGLTGLDTNVTLDGGFGGVVVGGQWQINRFVIGVEGDYNWANIDGQTQVALGNFINSEVEEFGAINAKVGVAINRFLAYGLAGVAFATINTGQNLPALNLAFTQSATYTGWTAGFGFDFAIFNNFIIGAQYRYYDFGSESFTPPAPFTARDQSVDMQTVSGHLTIKFGGGP